MRRWRWFILIMLCGMLLLAFTVISGWYSIALRQPVGSRVFAVGAGNGQFVFAMSDTGLQIGSGFTVERFDPHWRWWLDVARTPASGQIMVPLWAPTLALFWVGLYMYPRKREPACCQSCGYPLTDLPTPTCPECGTTTDA